MGNNPSTPQPPPGSSRSSRNSPRTRTTALPAPAQGPDPPNRTVSSRRRKPSIELPDVQSPAAAVSTSTPRLPRRKGSDRPPVVDEEPDPDPPEGPGGSLRGALQGKAEHVVYGPRRQDDQLTLLKTPPALVPTPNNSTSPASPATAMAIPGAGTASHPHLPPRTPGGGGPGARDGSLTNAGMGAIGVNPLMDPDDTTHPDFGNSARLTSAVLMSTEHMPVVGSPTREGFNHPTPRGPAVAPTSPSGDTGRRILLPGPQTSFGGAASSILAPSSLSVSSSSGATATPTATLPVPGPGGHASGLPSHEELPLPHTASPTAPTTQPSDTVLAPSVPAEALPLAREAIPSGTSVIASPPGSGGPTTPLHAPTGLSEAAAGGDGAGATESEGGGGGRGAAAVSQRGLDGGAAGAGIPSPAVLLPPAVLNAPVAAIPIPLLSVPSQTIAQSLLAAAVDLGAGENGVPTLIKWKNEDDQQNPDPATGRPARGPREVFVTGTFANGWKTKIELHKTDPSDFSALLSLPPGPHRLKFIVDDEWKASKHLPVATDADGNLINYLQVNPVNSKIPITVWAPPPPTATTGAGTTAGGGVDPGAAAAGTTGGLQAPPPHAGFAPSLTTPSATPVPGVPVTTAVPTTSVPFAPVPNSATATPLVGPGGGKVAGPGYNGGLYWPLGVADDDESTAGPGAAGTAGGGPGRALHPDEDDANWSQEIPSELVAWGEWEAVRDELETAYYTAHPNGPDDGSVPPDLPPPPPSAGVQPPTLPAQLEKGPLNHAAYVTQGSGDDNSILPKPDHSVINHLAASPIKGGFLSVGVTTRYKRKFVTIVYYKALNR